MPRKLRTWYPGAKYHVITRGNRRELLFYDQRDYQKYLDILFMTQQHYPFLLHTYCLMTNHTHLQLETFEKNISKIMHHINFQYAIYLNHKYEKVGHVFEGRFKTEIINSFEYVIDLSKYIHLNPYKAEMVERIEDYHWSSYRAYISNEENPYISKDFILSFFPEPQEKSYQDFVEGKTSSPLEPTSTASL